MSTPYLIRFTPAGKFFFGGPASFSDGFFVKSEWVPQPTTVMGALRASLLMGGKLLLNHKKRGRFIPPKMKSAARRLTGTAKLNSFEENPDFGVIDRVSPVFLTHTDQTGKLTDAYFQIPLDVAWVEKNGEQKKARYVTTRYRNKPGFVSNCGIKGAGGVPLSDFKQKEADRKPRLGGADFWKAYLAAEALGEGILELSDKAVFIEASQVGIGLEKRRVKERAFYVKSEYTLREGYGFSVIVWMTEDAPVFTDTITLGGEQSVFRLDCRQISPDDGVFGAHPLLSHLLDNNTKADNDDSKKLIACSPLVLSESSPLFAQSEHAIVGHVENVRMLVSANTDDKDKSGNSPFLKDGRKVIKSEAYRVIPAGSVFYLKPGETVEMDRTSTPGRIGYNHALEIPMN
jgi:CRISPR/Cas system CMR-associated protein Cmr3 (group 5 of RAMP superfamily)